MVVTVKVRFKLLPNNYIEYETLIKISYENKSRSVSFYKNNINQGVAFVNVASGLYPSLDLWFESGTIEIIKSSEKITAL